jgi:tetratricopeptide (TPR) repeat protein
MTMLNKLRAARLDGKAIKCFSLGMYSNVIEYLEKACEIDQEKNRNGIRSYYLGLSYINLGITQKAAKSLSIAYKELYERTKEDRSFLDKFRKISTAYVGLLLKNGEKKLASELIGKTDKLLIDSGYELDFENKQTKRIIENSGSSD